MRLWSQKGVQHTLWGRRNTLAVLIDILSCITQKGGVAKKTEVAQCSNLNTNVFNRYITLLENAGAITLRREGRNVHILLTQHGKALLLLLRLLHKLLEPYDAVLDVVRYGRSLEAKIAQIVGLERKLTDENLLPLSHCLYFLCVSPRGFCCLTGVEEDDKLLELYCCERRENSVTCNAITVKVEDPNADPPQSMVEYVARLCGKACSREAINRA